MFYAIFPHSLVPEDVTYKNLVKVQRNNFSMLALSMIGVLATMGFSCACWYSNWSFTMTQTQNLVAGCLMMTSVVFFVLGIGYWLTHRHMLKRLEEPKPVEVEAKKEPNPNTAVKV